MRLRVLVGAAGTPAPVSRHPFDVLENGVTGARWTVADEAPDAPLNEARAALLRALQARVGAPARPLQQVLVRLPRRLSGPRLFPWAYGQEFNQGWAEVLRWLRGFPPSNYVDLAQSSVSAAWEYDFRGAGLGHPAPQRYPRRTRSRRGRSRKQRRREVELGLRPSFGRAMSAATGLPESLLDIADVPNIGPKTPVMRTTARTYVVGSKPGEIRLLEENPELPKRPAIGPNDPNPWGVDPAPPTVPTLRLADLRRARAELEARAAPTNEDGTYNAFLGPAEMYELRRDLEFQRIDMGAMWPGDAGPVASVCGLRLILRRRPGWAVEPGPIVPVNPLLPAGIDLGIVLQHHPVRGELTADGRTTQIQEIEVRQEEPKYVGTHTGSGYYRPPRYHRLDITIDGADPLVPWVHDMLHRAPGLRCAVLSFGELFHGLGRILQVNTGWSSTGRHPSCRFELGLEVDRPAAWSILRDHVRQRSAQ